MKKQVLAIGLLALVVALSGCVQQGEQYQLTQADADFASKEFTETYDVIADVADANACQFTEDGWCREEDKQSIESSCSNNEFPEDCINTMKVWANESHALFQRSIKESDKRRPLAVNLKQTRSQFDVLEIGSSFMKRGRDSISFTSGFGYITYYNTLITEGSAEGTWYSQNTKGTPFEGLNDEAKVKQYFSKVRKDFDEKKNVNITGEKSWDILYTPSSDGNTAMEIRNFFSDAWINSLPSEKKEEAYGRTRMGFDEFLEICKAEASKFDAAESGADKYQLAFSAGYLSYCNTFLDKFSN